ncbi:hypothetical protein ABEB36_002431 [Hypothenemus hampei]|uniref:Microtubule-associated protein Jupiter n=1 Tax=Hypothenemus hampei TaxID=57062 RepID=A0ABD1F8T6_HYPHA
MANVFVGFPEHRNSSRVLKPPGGGTSNIFGQDIIPDIIPRKETKHRGSTIQDVLRTETVTNNVTKDEEQTHTDVLEENESGSLKNIDSIPDVAAKVSREIEELKIVEKSSIVETDSVKNTEILTTETVIQQNANVKKGSSIGDILNQDDILEKKKVKGQTHQRVPPGGYSSGLW